MDNAPTHDQYVDWELKIATVKADAPRLREAMEIVLTHYVDYARQYRAYYDALLAQQFTPEQALAIVLAHGWIPR